MKIKRVEHIASSGRQLQGLMHDVMDLGRFEGAELRIDLCALDASACVRIAADAVAALADQAGVSLVANHGSSSICCAADADRLHQCLLNLLSNAIKYSRPGGSVQIEVRQALHEVAIAVRDDGLGMSAAQRQQLFEPFNRLGRQHSAAPGSGLGLVITRHLVRAMNGQLRIDSEPGVGSCFTIVLPAALDTAVT